MGASDSRGQPELDSQVGGGPYDDDADTGAAARNSRKGQGRACVGEHNGGGGAGFKFSAKHHTVYRDTEPRVILDNKSSYRVSYWVVEEDKNITIHKASHPERLFGSMTRYLNASNVGGGTWAKEGQQEEDEDDEEGVYFLTRDHRMEPRGGTQATKVPFPVGCQEMRVCAFFEEDGQWHRFQDREISIGLFRKVFTVSALDADIVPHTKYRGSSSST